MAIIHLQSRNTDRLRIFLERMGCWAAYVPWQIGSVSWPSLVGSGPTLDKYEAQQPSSPGALNSTSDLSTYTFTNHGYGSAHPDRRVIVAIAGRSTDLNLTLNSVTIGGVTATIVIQQRQTTNDCNVAAIAVAHVPTGATGNFVISWSATCVCMGLQRYVVYYDPISYDTDSAVAADNTNVSLSIDAPATSRILAVGAAASSSAQSWTGIYEHTENTTDTLRYSPANRHYLSSTTQAITFTPGGVSPVAVAWCFSDSPIRLSVGAPINNQPNSSYLTSEGNHWVYGIQSSGMCWGAIPSATWGSTQASVVAVGRCGRSPQTAFGQQSAIVEFREQTNRNITTLYWDSYNSTSHAAHAQPSGNGSGTAVSVSFGTPSLNTWVTYGVTRDTGVGLFTYVDGAPANESLTLPTLTGSYAPTVMIGGLFASVSPSPGGIWDGDVAFVAIFKRALSAGEHRVLNDAIRYGVLL